MTREQLESYKSVKEEIEELKLRLSRLREEDSMMGSSVINDYRSGYPVPQAIVGIDWEKAIRAEKRYKDRIHRLEQEADDIEEYVEGIGDSLTRRIFRMYYLEGKSQKEIEKAVGLDRSCVSRKINLYLKKEKE